MIEKDDRFVEGHTLGKDGRIISDKYRRSIEKLRRLVNEFDALVEPEVSDLSGTGVGVTEDGPTISTPASDTLPKGEPVEIEAGLKFRHRYPDGSWRVPVERDGDSSWLVFIPEAGMPRVQLWTTDTDGRPVITPGPPSRHFIVRTEEHDYIAMLFRQSEWAVMWPDSDREVYVGLPRPVLDVNHWSSWITDDIAVTGDEQRPPKPLPCYFPPPRDPVVDPPDPFGESVPDR